jgi:hypothetical protein
VTSLTAIRDDLQVKFLLKRGDEKAGPVQSCSLSAKDVSEGAEGDLERAEGAVGEAEARHS